MHKLVLGLSADINDAKLDAFSWGLVRDSNGLSAERTSRKPEAGQRGATLLGEVVEQEYRTTVDYRDFM